MRNLLCSARKWAGVGAAILGVVPAIACEHHGITMAVPTTEGGGGIPPIPRFSVENMDLSADPRDDFYQFAAGAWEQRTEIPADKSRWGGFEELAERNWWNIRSLLETHAAEPGPAGSIGQKVGDFFASAMDQATIDARGIEPLQPTLDEITAIASTADLIRAVAQQHLGLSSPFFGVAVFADMKQSDMNTLYLVQSGLSLPGRDYYFEERFETERAALKDHIVALYVLAGETSSEAQRRADLVYEIELALAEKSKRSAELRDRLANYHKFTVDEAMARWSALQLDTYFNELGVSGQSDTLVVMQPEFLDRVQELVQSRPLDDLKVYLHWHALSEAATYLADPFERERFHFSNTVLRGTPEMEPRWQRAARVIDRQIGEALGQLYVARFFPPEVKARLDEMIENIKVVLRGRLERLEWMTPETRQRALAKFARFEAQIGYPEKWRDYSNVEVARDDYFGNVVRGAIADSRDDLAKVGKPVDKREFSLTPQTVNAYFQPTANQIVFLAGILQPPFFDAEADDAVNYGAIGAVIGHEITHGFDDQGRRFDADGNLTDWWTPEDEAEFKRRAQLLVDQFNAYEVLPGVFVQGELALGENIADLGGVSIAFEAFQRSLEGKPKPRKIDGFTAEQRFFLSWAQQWRTKFRDSRLKEQVTTGPHAPGFLRATGPLVNVDAFFTAFGIKEGDGMWRPPEKRARIW